MKHKLHFRDTWLLLASPYNYSTFGSPTSLWSFIASSLPTTHSPPVHDEDKQSTFFHVLLHEPSAMSKQLSALWIQRTARAMYNPYEEKLAQVGGCVPIWHRRSFEKTIRKSFTTSAGSAPMAEELNYHTKPVLFDLSKHNFHQNDHSGQLLRSVSRDSPASHIALIVIRHLRWGTQIALCQRRRDTNSAPRRTKQVQQPSLTSWE